MSEGAKFIPYWDNEPFDENDKPEERPPIPIKELDELVEAVGFFFGGWLPEDRDLFRNVVSAFFKEQRANSVTALNTTAAFGVLLALWAELHRPLVRGSVYNALESVHYSLQNVREQLGRRRLIPYSQYLETSHWKTEREMALERAGSRCALCDSEQSLNVHHRTYERLWDELPGDLIVLCRDCHAKFHDKLP